MPAASGNYWDVRDGASSCGEIGDGGQDAYDGFGSVSARVVNGASTVVDNTELCDFNLVNAGRNWSTAAPVEIETSGVMASRSIYAPLGTDYLRYVDTFTNTTGSTLDIYVAVGGDVGSDSDTTLARTSSGDLSVTAADTWFETIENSGFDPNGLATDPPVGMVLRSASDSTFTGLGDYDNNPFDDPWPGNGNEYYAAVFHFVLAPGRTSSIATFLVHTYEEGRTGPSGQPAPAAGEQTEAARALLASLSVGPNWDGLSASEVAGIVNWNATGAQVNRTGYCSIAGNTNLDGVAIKPGTFLDLADGQPANDPHYKGATPSFYYQGLGLSCDSLPGYTKTGELVGYGGKGDPGTYTYLAKN